MKPRSGPSWKAYCRRMAMDTYALAERSDAPDIMAAYIEIAAQWLRRAEAAPRRPTTDIDPPLMGRTTPEDAG